MEKVISDVAEVLIMAEMDVAGVVVSTEFCASKHVPVFWLRRESWSQG